MAEPCAIFFRVRPMTTRRTFLGGMAAILVTGIALASARSGVR